MADVWCYRQDDKRIDGSKQLCKEIEESNEKMALQQLPILQNLGSSDSTTLEAAILLVVFRSQTSCSLCTLILCTLQRLMNGRQVCISCGYLPFIDFLTSLFLQIFPHMYSYIPVAFLDDGFRFDQNVARKQSFLL